MNDIALVSLDPVSATDNERDTLWRLRAALSFIGRSAQLAASFDDLLAQHPVLCTYLDEAARCGCDGMTVEAARARIDARLGVSATPRSPLDRLRAALDLDADAVSLFVLCGLAGDDPRLASAVDAMLGCEGRVTRALASSWLGPRAAGHACAALTGAGFLSEERAGRQQVLGVPPAVWSAACGEWAGSSEWRYTPPSRLPLLSGLVLPDTVTRALAEPADTLCWIVRGAPGSGRHTLAGALARRAGHGLIEPAAVESGIAAPLGALATLLDAAPLVSPEPAPGERLQLGAIPGYSGMLVLRVPLCGAVAVEDRACRRIDLDMPDAGERRLHWRRALEGGDTDPALAALRLGRATIHRVAKVVHDGCASPVDAVTAEVEAQGRYRLDGLARRVAPLGPHEALAAADHVRSELAALVARCRHREALGDALPAAFGDTSAAGVRALFKGPSGTGKTLAARHLAAQLHRPLYRVDLAANVSKYIGETERNLERVFAAAESLDLVLLLDEGDALLAGRTEIVNSTDRYANLETNYLLQRLEGYSGILVVTTNAADRIDSAFARRIDVTIEFALPDGETRFELWQTHLPRAHAISAGVLEEVARRCALSGGQIRNAALHATLLALDRGAPLGDDALLAALDREYRKAGQSCPSFSAVR